MSDYSIFVMFAILCCIINAFLPTRPPAKPLTKEELEAAIKEFRISEEHAKYDYEREI